MDCGKNPDSDYRKHVEEIDKYACLSAGVCVCICERM